MNIKHCCKKEYDYFNITTEQISKDHRNGELEYPLCTCTDAAYHE